MLNLHVKCKFYIFLLSREKRSKMDLQEKGEIWLDFLLGDGKKKYLVKGALETKI